MVCALFGFMACTQNSIEEQSAIRTDTPETIRAGFEDDETRIQLNEAQKTVWTKGDLVSVFYRSNANQQWKYDGETGARTAELKRVDAGSATRDMDRVVVVYPYNKDYYINPETYNVQATLPATQHYLANSYGRDGNIMISSSEYNQFSLKSVCGWLKLQLTGDGAVVKSIKFRGNNDEQVAGELYINSTDATAMLASDIGGTDDNNAGGNLVFDNTILTEVVLDCGEGVTLGKSATAFYIALPPQTFTNGFTVEIEDTDGYAMEQSTAKTFVVERNTISPMAALEFVNPNHSTQPTPANNEIWYTNGKKGWTAEPAKTDVFGVNIISNTYDAQKECWVIKFDGDVTTIGESAFYDCYSLESVTIPDSVTSIGWGAFENCGSLTSVTIGNGVTEIGNQAFYDCTSLTSVTIPNAVTTIRNYAFSGCSSLTNVIIGNGVTSIGYLAFSGCSSLTSVTIGNGLTEIGDNVFNGCSSLQEFNGDFASEDGRCIIIEGVLKSFASAGLTEYTIPDSVTSIGSYAFDGSTLASITIPESVTSIGSYAFFGCDSLTSITIPDSVTTIGESAFHWCSNLKEFNSKSASKDGRCLIIDGVLCSFAPAELTEYAIPNDVTSIGKDIFYGCSSLINVTIPENVTSIGSDAFFFCSSLTSIYCKRTTPPKGGANMFLYNASSRKIYVPSNSVSAYRSAEYWSDYKSYIVGYNF